MKVISNYNHYFYPVITTTLLNSSDPYAKAMVAYIDDNKTFTIKNENGITFYYNLIRGNTSNNFKYFKDCLSSLVKMRRLRRIGKNWDFIYQWNTESSEEELSKLSMNDRKNHQCWVSRFKNYNPISSPIPPQVIKIIKRDKSSSPINLLDDPNDLHLKHLFISYFGSHIVTVNLLCSHCQLSRTHRDMIECDDCCKWFHW